MLFGLEAAFRTAFAEPNTPACAPNPPIEESARYASDLFEGIVVDKWTDLLPTRKGLVREDHYRFQVVRAWQHQAPRREVLLTHAFLEGYTYHSFELGRRYLVFAILHDMPAQLFAARCSPMAEGEDIAILAERLGPPIVTFYDTNVIEVPVRTRLARHARNALAIAVQSILPALEWLDDVL
jgi:hypothetical protein